MLRPRMLLIVDGVLLEGRYFGVGSITRDDVVPAVPTLEPSTSSNSSCDAMVLRGVPSEPLGLIT